jgi:uncharacterized alkaline shock family protein YloU
MAESADDVAAAVMSVPGVARLHAGMFGEVGTYLPGRRVPGVRITDDGTEVHVVLIFGIPVRETAERIRDAVAAVVEGRVDVTVEDVVALDSTDCGIRDTAGGARRDHDR